MLRYSGSKGGRWFLGFGLSEANLTRLATGQPIRQTLEPLGLEGVDVFIVYGREMPESESLPTEPQFCDTPEPGFMVPMEVGENVAVTFTGETEGRLFIGFGLTDENLDNLRSGCEIVCPLGVCGLPEVDAILTYGLTEESIQQRLEIEMGCLPRVVVDERTPEQRRGVGFGKG